MSELQRRLETPKAGIPYPEGSAEVAVARDEVRCSARQSALRDRGVRRFPEIRECGFSYPVSRQPIKYFRIVAHGLCTAGVITDSISFDARASIIGAAKRARYRKYGSATWAFGISALSLRAPSRDKSTSSALSGTHGALAGALHYSSCGTRLAG